MAEERNLWTLPEVTGVEISSERFAEPRTFYKGTQPLRRRDAVSIMVETADSFPIRGLSPALYVGDYEIRDYDQVGSRSYQFWGFEPEELRDNAPISLGWPPLRDRRVQTRFRYHPPASRAIA